MTKLALLDSINSFVLPGEVLSTATFHGQVIVATTAGVYVYDGITLQKIEPLSTLEQSK